LARVTNCYMTSTEACLYTNSINAEGHELTDCLFGGSGRIAHIINGTVHINHCEVGIANAGAKYLFEIDSSAIAAGWNNVTVNGLQGETTAPLIKYTGSSSDIHASFAG